MTENKGYSLIEVAVATMLVGLALGMYLQHFTARHERTRYEITQKRLEEVRVALTAYAAQKGSLPCPQSPEIAISTYEEIDVRCKPDASPPMSVVVFTSDQRSAAQSDEVWTGALPARDLRLNDEQTYDGWGRFFTYAVSRSLTFPDSLRKNPLPTGVLTIEDAFGNNLLPTPNTGRYAVVSHGATGGGGWSVNGGKRPCAQKTLDSKNCDGDASFVSASFAPAGGKHFYDDLVIFDDLDAGGTLLDKLVKCNASKMFYLPAEAGADSDGCKGYNNVIEGACLITMTLMPDGKFAREPPHVVMQPSLAQGAECSCAPGYTTIELATWDMKDYSVLDTKTGTAEGYVGTEESVYGRSALYVCTR